MHTPGASHSKYENSSRCTPQQVHVQSAHNSDVSRALVKGFLVSTFSRNLGQHYLGISSWDKPWQNTHKQISFHNPFLQLAFCSAISGVIKYSDLTLDSMVANGLHTGDIPKILPS